MKGDTDTHQLQREAWARRREGDYAGARILVEQAQVLCSEDDHLSLGRIYHIYMQLEADHNNHPQALALSQKSIAQYTQSGSSDHIAHSTRHLADLQVHVGRYAEAEQNYREALSLYRESPATKAGNLANALRGFALLLEQLGKVEEAIDAWSETKELYGSIPLPEGEEEAKRSIELLQKH